MDPNNTEVVIIEVQMTTDGYWRAFVRRPVLPEADAAPGWYSRSKKGAMTHALAEQFKPSVVTCLDGKHATVHFPDGESVDVQLLYR